MLADDVLVALRAETEAMSAVLFALEPAQFALPTNCPPWDLRELVVHTAASVRIGAPIPAADTESVPSSAADYYRRPERDTGQYRQRNVDNTQELARQLPAEASPAQFFDEVTREAVTKLGHDDLDRIVLIAQRGAMRLADWVVTRVISVAAHGLDVAITLDRPPWTTSAALTVIRLVFVELIGAPLPASLGWDDHRLLATATGRQPLTAEERQHLGPLQERFPVLS